MGLLSTVSHWKNFLKDRRIKITHSPPYHPQSNGIVERAVQTTKSVLRKFINDSNPQINDAIEKFLKNYRNLPSTTEEIVPAIRMFSYQPRWELTELKITADKKQLKSKEENKSKARINLNRVIESVRKNLNCFLVDEKVLYISHLQGYTHATEAKIIRKESEHVYRINVCDVIKLAHVNQLRKLKKSKFIYNSLRQEEDQEVQKNNKKRKVLELVKETLELRRSSRISKPVRDNPMLGFRK